MISRNHSPFSKIRFVTVFVSCVQYHMMYAQTSKPDTLYAVYTEGNVTMDGLMNEETWKNALPIKNFTQRDPREGEPSTERTEVYLVYNQTSLFFGIKCFDSEPDKIVAKSMKWDFSYSYEDNIIIILDTYNDDRNGYLFVTNPNGAMADAMISDNGNSLNQDWNGVWISKARITSEGWMAEIEIPFSILKFNAEPVKYWGINFDRSISRKLEQVRWQGWSRDASYTHVSRAGTLAGINNLRKVRLLEFRPYGIGGAGWYGNQSAEKIGDIGMDINYLITSNFKLNATINPDFAQVEADQVQINLSRFSLFYPEKRKFFLEGRDLFNFGVGFGVQPFYSRRIGLSYNGKEIPIYGGVRLTGKTKKANIGVMSLQTSETDSSNPSYNYSVIRWKQDIFGQASAGIFSVNRISDSRANNVMGGDVLYSTSKMFGDKYFYTKGSFAQSYTSDNAGNMGSARGLYLVYPNDLFSVSGGWERVTKRFNPEAGFLSRNNYQGYYGSLEFTPRPAFMPWIKKMEFIPWDFTYYLDDSTKEIQSFNSEFRPLAFATGNGQWFESNFQLNAENITDPKGLDLFGVNILPGIYWYKHYELQYGTYQAKPLSAYLFINWGEFYNGSRTTWSAMCEWKINKHFRVNTDVTQYNVSLEGGNFTINQISARSEFAINPLLIGSIYGQWNDEENSAILNFRVNWIPRPGTDFFFVFNQYLNTGDEKITSETINILAKLVWRFAL